MIESVDEGGNKRVAGAIVGTPDALALAAAEKMFKEGKTLEQAAKEIGEDVKADPSILENDVVLPVPPPPPLTPGGAAATLNSQRARAMEKNPQVAQGEQQPAPQDGAESSELDRWMKNQYLDAVLTLNGVDPFGKTFEEKDNIFILLRRPPVPFPDWCRAKGYTR